MNRAATRAKYIINAAPIAKLAARRPPLPYFCSSASSSSRAALGRPLVPRTTCKPAAAPRAAGCRGEPRPSGPGPGPGAWLAPTAVATATTAIAAAEAAAATSVTVAATFASTPLVERPSIAATIAITRWRTFTALAFVAVFGRLEQRPMRQVDAAHAIDLGHQDLQLVADVDHVLDRGHPMVGQLRDMDQAFFARQDLDEGAERHDARYLACVD